MRECFRGIGSAENYQDSLAHATNCVRERAGTCSETRTSVRIKQGKGLPPRQCRRRHGSSVGNHSDKDICPSSRRERGTSRNSSTGVPLREHRGKSSRGTRSLSFVDEDLAPRAIPKRIIARKLCARAYVHVPARSSTFGKLFPAAAVASKSR